MRNVWDVEPGAVQVRPRDFLDAGQRPGLDRTELGKILSRDLGNAHAAGGRRYGGCGGRSAQEGSDVLPSNPTLLAGSLDCVQIDLKLARETPDAWARMRLP